MNLQDLRSATREQHVIDYVCANTRCMERVGGDVYAVRHPTPYAGGRALIKPDTRELVLALCATYHIDRRLQCSGFPAS